ncbi:MAG: hypothetical protein IPH78_07695 [Bacteroidetes bacterium]|nr:hypothetical protein [Bacteroidota bacterium]
MKCRVWLFPAVLVVLLINSCKEEAFTPLNFSEFTRTTDSCSIIGTPDLTDFTNDPQWTAQEEKVMSFKNLLSGADSMAGNLQVFPICKNPNHGSFSLGIFSEKACKLKLAFVNYDMDILQYATLLQDSGEVTYPFDFSALSAFRPNENYRLYYSMSTAADSVYYRGHGDFRIEQE